MSEREQERLRLLRRALNLVDINAMPYTAVESLFGPESVEAERARMRAEEVHVARMKIAVADAERLEKERAVTP